MQLTQIVRIINDKLAGENLSYDALKGHMDAVIDDINEKLDSTFPSFTEFTMTAYPACYPNYNFFPDKYIRSVVGFGSAYKFFTTDEEGADVAPKYEQEYYKHLFYMERDYMEQVPEEFQAKNTGSIRTVFPYYTSKTSKTYWD